MEIRQHLYTKRGYLKAHDKLPNIIGRFTPDDVLPYIDKKRKLYVVNNKIYYVSMSSKRYKLFQKSLYCVACGLKADVVLLEQHLDVKCRNKNKAHFEFYGTKDGMLILMTKDHITPVSQKGNNELSNLQTLCYKCNEFKGNNTSISLTEIASKKMINQTCKYCGTIIKANKCFKCNRGIKLQNSLKLAMKLHNNEFRKHSNIPYIVHPIAVMKRLSTWGIQDDILLSASLLHDTIENNQDKNVPHYICSLVDGKKILAYVEELTLNTNQLKEEYIATFVKKSVPSLLIKISDRIENVYDFLSVGDTKYAIKYFHKADAIWDAFTKRAEEIVAKYGEEVYCRIQNDIVMLKAIIDG